MSASAGDLGEPPLEAARRRWLLGGAFIIAASGLAYELIAGAAASYLLGDSVTQYSLVIGVFMAAMGLGAWAARHVTDAAWTFCAAQTALALIGGASGALFYVAWLHVEPFQAVLFGAVIATGALSGLEIPLLVRLLGERGAGTHALSNVLTLDYAGALLTAAAFPLLIAPQLGLVSAGFLFGLLNACVGAAAVAILEPKGRRALLAALSAITLALGAGLVLSERVVRAAEAGLYADEVVHAETTRHQRIVLTRYRDRTRLFLDGAIQFDSRDEHRYHEALAHPALTRALRLRHVLILGGGDGMAAREALRYAEVETVTLVDLDPAVTALFSDGPLAALNGGALRDPRLEIVHADAWRWTADQPPARYDVILVDLPDPKTLALSKLYSRAFYTRLGELLAPGGAIAVQAGAPFYAREAYWSVIATLEASRDPFAAQGGLAVAPYAAWVPSFGLWGFALAGPAALAEPRRAPPEALSMYSDAQWAAMTHFPSDVDRLPVAHNSVLSHALLRYYREGWARIR
ncbi:MAG: polyamine aminopropyltransferase [Pseudomonadota bacterium]